MAGDVSKWILADLAVTMLKSIAPLLGFRIWNEQP